MKAYTCFPDGKVKALTMSYDDGRMEDKRLIEIFNRYGIKGTFNLNYGWFLGKYAYERVPRSELTQIYQGHEIATHGYTHATLARCSFVEVADEILKDRLALEAEIGGLVRGHAYPNGSYNEEIKELLRHLGIAYGRACTSTGNFRLPADLMEWNPTCHHNDPRLMELTQKFIDMWRRTGGLQLMYVWGHSYEFTNDNNWERIEEFCKQIGGRDDIWYCTNIEYVDYMKVIQDLQYTASMDAVYNPSAASAWLEIEEGRVIEIKGGSWASLK